MSQEAVIQSRQFPLRFLSAYKVIMELSMFGKLAYTDCDLVIMDNSAFAGFGTTFLPTNMRLYAEICGLIKRNTNNWDLTWFL